MSTILHLNGVGGWHLVKFGPHIYWMPPLPKFQTWDEGWQVRKLSNSSLPCLLWVRGYWQVTDLKYDTRFTPANTDCRDFKWGVQNQKDFCLRINIPKGNYWILKIGLTGAFQKSEFLIVNYFPVKWICTSNWIHDLISMLLLFFL